MDENGVKQGRTIGNVGVLDIRKATDETVAGIREIGNVGAVVYSEETAHLISRLSMGNLGTTVEVPADVRFRTHTGQLAMTPEYFKGEATPVYVAVTGRIEVAPELPPEEIERGLGGLVVFGELVYPESLAGALQSKILQVTGKETPYPPGDRVVTGNLTLDESYLGSLGDASMLVVTGALNVPDVLPNELLEQKLRSLKVRERIRCHEENAKTVLERQSDSPWHPKVAVIPSGYALIDGRIVLDGASLTSLPGRKLYCTRRVQLDVDLVPDVLDESLDSLIVEGLLICPAALREVVSHKCNVLETKSVFYQGRPWPVEQVQELAPTALDYVEGKISLLVFGVLTISPDIEPNVLADRLADVNNFGVISCTAEQMGAIQARLGLNEGVLGLLDEDEDDDSDIGNVGYMAL